MGNYSKFVGAIVGAVIGMALVALHLADSAGIPADIQPFADKLLMLIMTALSTYVFPANVDPTAPPAPPAV